MEERRKHVRVRVEYVLSVVGEKVRGQGIVQDLSVAGCRARSLLEVSAGDFVSLLIDVPRYDNPLHVDKAVIRWVKERECGMEFMHIAPEDQQRIQEVIGGSGATRPA